MSDATIYEFLLAWFIMQTALGFYLGKLYYGWRVKRLQSRIELLKLEAFRR